jgi:protein-S-isoprenylcysteine O-methyltransferase
MHRIFLQTHASAGALVAVSAFAYAAVEWRVSPRERTAGDSSADRGTKRILMAGMFGGFALGWLAAAWLTGLALLGSGWIWVALGFVVFWFGVGLRLRAIAVLGRFFRRDVVIQEGHRVVRDGPYRLLRHPAYTGNLLIVLGYGLTLSNWASLAVVVVLPLLGLMPRIRVEEAALEESLGDGYRDYESETRRLIPGVW